MAPGKPADPTAATVPADASAPVAFDGGQVGRYLLLGELGRGAMGQVFAGYDPDLGRRVAVKLVAGDPAAFAPYLMSEARALATLSHPNIVPVFDVGQDAGRIYIVMELVDGMSLADWIEEPRGLAEIVRTWCAAGRGLAAAHASGVVHRDFKASNVLIGKAGHVRVADFGLARAPDQGEAHNPVAGTRDHMAPEVVARGAATEAVDQYAFCVSLARALGTHKVPRRIRRIVERGVATDPADRWPSMATLVDALERAQRLPRAWLAAAVAVVLAGTASVSWWALGRDAAIETCTLGRAVVARELPPELRVKLDATLRDGPPAQAHALAGHIAQMLDASTIAWSAAYDAACGSPDRAACLDHRLGELAMTLRDQIAAHGNDLLDLPVEIARWRDALVECDRGTAASDVSADYRHAMARALALSYQGRSTDAAMAANEAVAAAREPRALVRAKVRRIYVESAPVPADFPPLFADAQATGDLELPPEVALAAAQACLRMTTWTCAREWTDRAAEAIARLPPSSGGWLRGSLSGVRGELAMRDDNPAVAVAMFQDELKRNTAERGADSFSLVAGWTSLGAAQIDLKQYGDAVVSTSAADQVVIHWLGEDHPYRATVLGELGAAKLKSGDTRGGIADLERALALRVAVVGDQSPRLASLYNNLAAAYQADGKPAQALALVDRAIACYARAASSERGRELPTLRNGAMLASLLARPDARTRIDQAISLAAGRLPADHPDRGSLSQTRAIIDLRLGDLAAADTDLREALTRFEHLGERAQPEQALTHGYLALLEIRRHRVAAADKELALADRLAAFTPTSIKRVWLDEVAVEVAIAHGDAANARRRLGPVGRTLEALPATVDVHVIAHYHLLVAAVALLEHDRETAVAEQTRSAAALEAAEIPAAAGFQDCSVCRPL